MTNKHDIMWFDILDSTNDEAGRHITRLDNLSVLSAMLQTSGRGQRGNVWTSEAGQNLTFSIVLKSGRSDLQPEESLPYIMAADQFVLSEIAALSVVTFLDSYGIKSAIKWPNDIYVGNQKICGMLIENSLRGESLSSSIIGIGLNVNQSVFDSSLPNPTSMSLLTGREFNVRNLLEEFMDVFSALYERHIVMRLPSRQAYLDRMWRLGTLSCYIDYTVLPDGHTMNPVVTGQVNEEGEEFHGIIRGLSPIGHLIVENIGTGIQKTYSFKEIGYIL